MYEEQTFEVILDRILKRMPADVDIRESSFLYNASAPIAVELNNMYIALDNILDITFFDTSDREGKLQRCRERGIDITQFAATKTVSVIKVLPITITVPIGSRFSCNNLNFVVTEKLDDGNYHIQCETAGTSGNVTGAAISIDYIDKLESAEIISIDQWGEDEAAESRINEVYYASLNSQAFGGNRTDYIEKIKSIAGVGGVKVYTGAEWKGGGTVKIVFTTSAYTKPSESFVNTIQTMIDPVENAGEGYGIAPIGHTVTVAGVNEKLINISMRLTYQDGYTWDTVSGAVNSAIDSYFLSINELWDNTDGITVRISQLETRILSIPGIIDIANTAFNGIEDNLIIDKDEIAVRGNVIAD